MPRPYRLPAIDTREYVACAIDTPLLDLDKDSPLPCIIVTPDHQSEYHIAYHPKSATQKHSVFAAQQAERFRKLQNDARSTSPASDRRARLRTRPGFFRPIPPPPSPTLDIDCGPFGEGAHGGAAKLRLLRARTALVLIVPALVIACHLFISGLARVNLGSSFGRFLGRPVGIGRLQAAHLRAESTLDLDREPGDAEGETVALHQHQEAGHAATVDKGISIDALD